MEACPLALDDGDLGQMFLGQTGFLHHPQHRNREARWRGGDAVRFLELLKRLQWEQEGACR